MALRLDSLPHALLALILAHAAIDDRARAACACRALREAAEDCRDVLDMKELVDGARWNMFRNAVRAKLWRRRGDNVRKLRLCDAFKDYVDRRSAIRLESALSIAEHCRYATVTEFNVVIGPWISDCRFGTPELPEIWKALSNLPGPFGALVYEMPITHGKLDWILPRGLVTLSVEQAFGTLRGLDIFPAVLNANPALRHLDLDLNDPDDTGELWAAIEEGLVANTTLESFAIRNCVLDQSAIDRFAVILSRNTTLQTLQITVEFDAGVVFQRLADAVRANKSLRLLTMWAENRAYITDLNHLCVAATRENPAVTVQLHYNSECDCKCGYSCLAKIHNGLVSWGCSFGN